MLPRLSTSRRTDWVLVSATIALVAIGLLVIWSISFKSAGGGIENVAKQGVSAIIGLAALAFMARVDYRLWRRLLPWLYIASIIFLVAVLFAPGVFGARRWINIGFFQFQPSEFAKLIFIVGLAMFLAKNYERLEKFRYLLFSIVFTALPVALIMKEPDLGTSLVIMFTWLIMILSSRVRKIYVLGLGLVGLACLPAIYANLQSYQRARIDTFLNPQAERLGDGHNVIQSIITIGSGQITGRGLGGGTQSQYNFLPQMAQHNDFIFAVLGEKMGLIGCLLLITLFAIIFWRGLIIAYRASDRFGYFLAIGIVAMMFFHTAVNIGMNMGLAPVTGIPLPFISSGGTSLLVNMAAIGLLLSIAARGRE